MNLFTKEKETHGLQKQACGYQRQKMGVKINQGFGTNIYIPLHKKQEINNDLLYSIGSSTQ